MKRVIFAVMAFALLLCMAACANTNRQTPDNTLQSDSVCDTGRNGQESGITENLTESAVSETGENKEKTAEMKMKVQIGNATFTAALEDNAAVHELIQMMKESPITIEMSDYSGFEKVGSLGQNLTTDNHQATTVAGDIVLYNGNHIVMFYGSNSWSYTRIGHIDDLTGWEDALGSGSITAVFSVEE